MGTTTKMAIPYPEATGLVKDGWEDMKDIATQVDAKTGLVFISTTSFTTVASQSFSNLFSSLFTNYLCVFDFESSADNFGSLQMRAGSTNETSANYRWQRLVGTGTTVSAASQTGQTSFDFGKNHSFTNGRTIHFFRPYVADDTAYFVNGGTYEYMTPYAGSLLTSTQYDGFTITASTGTYTGSMTCFGYRNS